MTVPPLRIQSFYNSRAGLYAMLLQVFHDELSCNLLGVPFRNDWITPRGMTTCNCLALQADSMTTWAISMRAMG